MKKMNPKTAISILMMMTVLVVHGQKLSKTDLAPMYSEYNFTAFKAVVYHSSDDKSTVYLNISLHHFKYISNGSGMQEANFSVKYELYESYNAKVPMDMATLFFSAG